MKLLYLHQYFLTADEPGATRSYETAKRLVARGHRVEVITSDQKAAVTDHSNSDWHTKNIDGVNVHSIRVPYNNDMNFSQRMRAFGEFALKAGSYGSALDYDLVFATSTPLTIAIPAVRLSRIRAVPMVFEVRDLWPQVPIEIGALRNPLLRRAAMRLEKYAYDNASAIVGLSPGITASILERFPHAAVETISNACDTDLFSPAETIRAHNYESRSGELPQKSLIVYAGTFGDANGVEYAVHVAKELERIAPDVALLLIGSGKNYTMVRELASQLGLLDKSVFVRESVPKKEMPHILSTAVLALSLFIDLPVLETNSANKFFDALASGTPVAINYGGWQAELINRTGCGLVLPPSEPENAALMIASFLEDESRVRDAGVAASQLAETDFSRDALVDKLAALLESLVTEG